MSSVYFSKIKLFIIKHKLHQIGMDIGIVVLLVIIFNQFIIPGGYFYQPEYISIWSTLFGALVGGIFTLWGTQIATQKENKGKFYIKQKHEILSPLYNELKEIHEIILPNNPYPYIVSFQKGSQTIIAHPQYSVWGEIKIDTRYFEVPKKLAIEMEYLYKAVSDYIEYRPIAASVVMDKTNEIMLSEFGFKCPIVNLGDTLLASVAYEKIECFYQESDKLLLLGNENMLTEISEEDKRRVYKIIYEKCNELLELNKFKSVYAIWIKQESQVIELLRVLIESINFRYHE